jgi:hypothetical protein
MFKCDSYLQIRRCCDPIQSQCTAKWTLGRPLEVHAQDEEIASLKAQLLAAKEEVGRLVASGAAQTQTSAGAADSTDPFYVWRLEEYGTASTGVGRLKDVSSNVLFTDERNVWHWPQVMGRMDSTGKVPGKSKVMSFMEGLDKLFALGGRQVECVASWQIDVILFCWCASACAARAATLTQAAMMQITVQ